MSLVWQAVAVLAALQPSGQSSPAQIAPPAPTELLTLRSGTPVPLVTSEDLTSLTARQGQRFKLLVADDVSVGNMLVIPKGTPAVGEVRRVVGKGMVGKRGQLEVQLLFVELEGHRIQLDGRAGDKGTLGTAPVVGTIVLAGLVGAFVTGTSAKLPSGTPLIGYTAKDGAFAPIR